MAASEFSAEARAALARNVRRAADEPEAALEEAHRLIENLLDSADAWHEAYRISGGETVDYVAHADGMDDAAVQIVDAVSEAFDPDEIPVPDPDE